MRTGINLIKIDFEIFLFKHLFSDQSKIIKSPLYHFTDEVTDDAESWSIFQASRTISVQLDVTKIFIVPLDVTSCQRDKVTF